MNDNGLAIKGMSNSWPKTKHGITMVITHGNKRLALSGDT